MPENFKKEDFLSVAQFAKKFGYDKETVECGMKKLKLAGATLSIRINPQGTTGPRPVIYQFKGNRSYQVHPLGVDILKDSLEKQRG